MSKREGAGWLVAGIVAAVSGVGLVLAWKAASDAKADAQREPVDFDDDTSDRVAAEATARHDALQRARDAEQKAQLADAAVVEAHKKLAAALKELEEMKAAKAGPKNQQVADPESH